MTSNKTQIVITFFKKQNKTKIKTELNKNIEGEKYPEIKYIKIFYECKQQRKQGNMTFRVSQIGSRG